MFNIKDWWNAKDPKEKTRFVYKACWLVSTATLAGVSFVAGRKYEKKHMLDKGANMQLYYRWNEDKQRFVIHPVINDKHGDEVFQCGYGYWPEDTATDMLMDMYSQMPHSDGSVMIVTNDQKVIASAHSLSNAAVE